MKLKTLYIIWMLLQPLMILSQKGVKYSFNRYSIETLDSDGRTKTIADSIENNTIYIYRSNRIVVYKQDIYPIKYIDIIQGCEEIYFIDGSVMEICEFNDKSTQLSISGKKNNSTIFWKNFY